MPTAGSDPLSTITASRRALMPPRVLPWLYVGVGHISLAVAFAAIAWDPRAAAGFFYHAHLAGIVHLITLGWITVSILGSLYVVGPLALRTHLPARWPDGLAFALVTIGIVGMVAHFWLEEFGGMAWSSLTVALGILIVGLRTLGALRRARVSGAVRLHVAFAFLNIGGAAAMGVLLGFDKVGHFLPGFVLSNVVAHAHLAAIGWASMMVVGIAYRLLPMVLPARPPEGRTLYASAILLQTGAVGLFVALIFRSVWLPLFIAAAAAGFLAFAVHVRGMLRSRRSRARGLPAIDYAVRHVAAAFVFLAIAFAIGTILAIAQPSGVTMRAALAYGVFGLIGFLAQMVAGMQIRLLPLLAWFTAARRVSTPDLIPSMTVMSRYRLAGPAWILWLWGVPAVAAGFFFNAIPLLAAGALALEIAVLAGAGQAVRLATYAFGVGRPLPFGADDADGRRVPARQSAVQASER
jgi:hypothetical protein